MVGDGAAVIRGDLDAVLGVKAEGGICAGHDHHPADAHGVIGADGRLAEARQQDMFESTLNALVDTARRLA